MGHEISQFDIHDRQLLAGKPQPKTGIVTDIGEAQVTRTMFGRARICVVREQDRKRRAWLLAILAVTATSAAAWQGWIIFQKMQHVAPHVPLSERILVSAPVFEPAHIAPDPHPSRQKSESLIQTEIDGLLSGPLPRHPPGWQPSEKPVAAQPSMANQASTTNAAPGTALVPAQFPAQDSVQDSIQEADQADTPVPAPAPARTTPQAAATAPAVAAPIANPLVKRDTTVSSPAGSVPHPVSAQD